MTDLRHLPMKVMKYKQSAKHMINAIASLFLGRMFILPKNNEASSRLQNIMILRKILMYCLRS